jgi:hypothetical protein
MPYEFLLKYQQSQNAEKSEDNTKKIKKNRKK